MNGAPPRRPGLPVSARLRLTLGYAAFLVLSGMAVLAGVYIVVRYLPDYPLTTADPSVTHINIASRGEIVAALVDVTLWVLAALAVIGLSGGWFLAGWVLRPLHRIDAAVRAVATGRLDHRIRLTGPDDEFRRLADAFDHMLDRLQDAFAVQERFAANASHELRTPLAVTATMLDVARRDPGHDPLIDRLSEVNARAVGLTEALLRLADVDAVTAAARPLDLADPVRRAVAEARGEAGRRGVDLRLEASPAPVTGDPELLLRLADNLVRNTLRHNVRGGTATVSVGRAPDGSAVLRTDNTGPVLAPETVARLTEPFLRGEGRTRRDGGGHGLGLALVSRVVDVHGGTLRLDPRPGGGLTVAVALPVRAHSS
ncbi:two-component system, OmpR family, sensor histidine kinase VanS [Nocardiopsis flavescens]|uniref:histidine kinase n=1 Tax=Nocardiopsis flavescens TaxID=758803 RepID=A0A1M6REX4_9ACTN|nr:HAMP domain-containing sensor histidine kinase [Nocardiopsis flavescens]SHK31002.1 two-component system, OmpR family, sensor histidine kinase VanS [Nocardiopsis flavescens]